MSGQTQTKGGTSSGTSVAPRPLLSRDVVLSFRRRRIEDALAELCAEQGYAATTIDHVRRRCGCARIAVYELFDSKADIFVSLLGRALTELGDCVEDACNAAPRNPKAQVRAGLEGLLTWVAAEPASAWVCFVESHCGPELSRRLCMEAIDRFTVRLAGVMPTDVLRPALTEELLVCGVAWQLAAVLRRGEAARAPELMPALLDFLLGPYRDVSQSSPALEGERG